MKRKVRFYSTPVQRAYERTYTVHTAALYQVGVLLRAVGTERQAASVEEAIDKRLETITTDMQAELKRLEQVRDDNGIADDVYYSAPLDIEAPISTRRAAVYLGILELWDRMLRVLDTLRLTAVITDKQFRDGVYVWRNQIARAVVANIQVARRAMIARHRELQETQEERRKNPRPPRQARPAGASSETGTEGAGTTDGVAGGEVSGEATTPENGLAEAHGVDANGGDTGGEAAGEHGESANPSELGAEHPDMTLELTDEHVADITNLANENEDGTPRKTRRRVAAGPE
jgi:hypothetical protein